MPLHLLLAHLAASTTATTTKATTTKTSSSYFPLLVLVTLFALGYFFFLRPRSQRMRQQQAGQRQIGVGDEVMSAGGIYGRVVAIDADEVEVEVAPGVVMTFIRRSISLRQAPPAAGLRRGGAAAPAAPIDDPWDSEPDGPGDRTATGDVAGGPDVAAPPAPPFAGGPDVPAPPPAPPFAGGPDGATRPDVPTPPAPPFAGGPDVPTPPAGGNWGAEGEGSQSSGS